MSGINAKNEQWRSEPVDWANEPKHVLYIGERRVARIHPVISMGSSKVVWAVNTSGGDVYEHTDASGICDESDAARRAIADERRKATAQI